MKRYITYMMMAMGMVIMFLLSGCGGNLGSSQDFSGTWGYVDDGKSIMSYESYGDRIYVLKIEKQSDHTYKATNRVYRYEHKTDEFLNKAEYVQGDRFGFIYDYDTPKWPNKVNNVKPKIVPVYTLIEENVNIEPYTLTEREGVLYVDSSGIEYTYDKEKNALISGKQTLLKAEEDNLSSLTVKSQEKIREYYQKNYVDKNRVDIPEFKFIDEPERK